MATLIGQTNKYKIYVGKETEIWFFSYQAEFLFSNKKESCIYEEDFRDGVIFLQYLK